MREAACSGRGSGVFTREIIALSFPASVQYTKTNLWEILIEGTRLINTLISSFKQRLFFSKLAVNYLRLGVEYVHRKKKYIYIYCLLVD